MFCIQICSTKSKWTGDVTVDLKMTISNVKTCSGEN
jgi:hypothetical protein